MYVHPSHLRLANRRRLSALLLAEGPATRADLARRLGLSVVTAGKVADELSAEGLIEESDEPAPTSAGVPAPPLGRPARKLKLVAGPRYAAVEIGVGETSVSAVGLDGTSYGIRSFRTPAGTKPFLADFRRAFAALVRETGDPPSAVLVSVPGVVDEDAERIVFSPNLHWTEGTALLPALGRVAAAPVVAVQEVRALALGLVASGDASEAFLLLEFGDGVGGAVVVGDAAVGGAGRIPLIGEIGHTRVPDNVRRCGCGGTGCLETLANRAGLLRSCRTALRRPRLDWDGLRAHVREHGIASWLAAAVDAVALIAAGAVNLLGIRDVVVMGDLPELGPDVVSMLAERLRRHALPARFGALSCRAAPRRRLLGLAAAAMDRLLLPAPSFAADRASSFPTGRKPAERASI